MGDNSYPEGSQQPQRKEIYTYRADWTIFGLAWNRRPDPTSQFKLAISSYVEQYSNVVSIIKKNPANDEGSLYKAAEFDHPYPCTKIMWSTDMRHGAKDLLATTGDYLRLWSVSDDGSGRGTLSVKKEALLNNNKTSEYCAPLTSFDWNETDPSIVGTSSIDTT
jgi:WD repeat-containing protein 68